MGGGGENFFGGEIKGRGAEGGGKGSDSLDSWRGNGGKEGRRTVEAKSWQAFRSTSLSICVEVYSLYYSSN